MRFVAITLFLIGFCTQTSAFETEADKLFAVENSTKTLRIISTVDMELWNLPRHHFSVKLEQHFHKSNYSRSNFLNPRQEIRRAVNR